MIIIGVTGNSGAGKSTISTIIKNNLNAYVVNADAISRELMKPGKEYYNEILKLFGKENVLNSKKSKNKNQIHRSKLAKIIFEDSEKRKLLNKLTFKYVGEEMKKQILECKNNGQDFVILDVPLLYESKFDKICNYVIAVIADEETKVKRLRIRDNLNENQDALNRLGAQPNDDFFKERADFIIDNSKGIGYFDLVKASLKIIHKIKNEQNI